MLSGPSWTSGLFEFALGLTMLPPPSAMECKSGSEMPTGMPKKSEGLR